MTVRFIHTADWQLGMTRHFLSPEAQARFTQARIDAIRTIGKVAREEGASFVVVAGDVFESNQLEPRTVRRTIEALRDVPVPVYLLPGNHDPFDASTIYRSATFVEHKPDHVIVLDDSSPRQVLPGVEVVGAPWLSKRVVKDLVQVATAELLPTDSIRVLVAHGVPRDPLAGENPAAIDLGRVEAAIADRRISYLALGDRHSTTSLGASGAIWYSGTPEPTAHDESDAGNVLVIELDDAGRAKVTPRQVGTWTFREERFELDSEAGIEPLAEWLDACSAKDRCAIRLNLFGTISLSTDARLQELLDRNRDVFGALEIASSSGEPLVVRPDDDDFADLRMTGFVDRAVEELRETAIRTGPDQQKARDALGLLIRLLQSRGGQV